MAYQDIQLAQPLTGYPQIALGERDVAVLSDHSGRCFTADLTMGEVTAHEDVSEMGGLVCNLISSLCLSRDGERCAAATRSGKAGIWSLESGKATVIFPSGHGPVNAVAFSPDDMSIAVGLGFYPLNPRHDVSASVEIWSLDDLEPEFLMSSALPGVCVDWIGWYEDWEEGGESLMLMTGDRDQQGGSCVQLDTNTLRAQRIDELDQCWFRNCEVVKPDAIVVVSSREICLRSLDSFRARWKWTSEDEIFDACVDIENSRILTTDGELIDLETGEMVDGVEVLDDCSCVAVRPGGGFIGISTSGVVRVWEV